MLASLWITTPDPQQADFQIGHTLGGTAGLPISPKKTNKNTTLYMGGGRGYNVGQKPKCLWPGGRVGTPRTKNWDGPEKKKKEKKRKEKKVVGALKQSQTLFLKCP